MSNALQKSVPPEVETPRMLQHKPGTNKGESEQKIVEKLTQKGKKKITFTGFASFRILPHEIASSGLAPLSLPSYSEAVFMKTEKSAPFLCDKVNHNNHSFLKNCVKQNLLRSPYH